MNKLVFMDGHEETIVYYSINSDGTIFLKTSTDIYRYVEYLEYLVTHCRLSVIDQKWYKYDKNPGYMG